MISEGRLVYIFELLNEAHRKLEESWDIGDQDLWIEAIGDAKQMLEQAIVQSRLLDKPMADHAEAANPGPH